MRIRCFGVLVFYLIHSPLDSTLNVKSSARRLSEYCLKALCVFSKEFLKTRNGVKKTTRVNLEDQQGQRLGLWWVSCGRLPWIGYICILCNTQYRSIPIQNE